MKIQVKNCHISGMKFSHQPLALTGSALQLTREIVHLGALTANGLTGHLSYSHGQQTDTG
jgi:hypothetical protein